MYQKQTDDGDGVITEYCIPSELTLCRLNHSNSILAVVTHFINRIIRYILKVEYSISNVARIYFNFIIINPIMHHL